MAKAAVSNGNLKNNGGVVQKLAKGINGQNAQLDEIMARKRLKHELRVSRERVRTRKMAKLYADLRALLPNLPTEPKADKATIVKAALDSIKFLEETLQNLEKQKMERFKDQESNDTSDVVVPFVDPSELENPVINNIIDDESLLEETLQNLEKQKMERLKDQESNNTSDVVVPFVDPSEFENPLINNIIDDEPLLVNQQQQQQVSLNFFETWTSPNVTISMCGADAHISICSLKKPGLFTTICFILNNHNHEIVSAQISSDDAKTLYMIHIRANVPPELVEGFPYEEMYKKAVEQIVLWINFEKL